MYYISEKKHNIKLLCSQANNNNNNNSESESNEEMILLFKMTILETNNFLTQHFLESPMNRRDKIPRRCSNLHVLNF